MNIIINLLIISLILSIIVTSIQAIIKGIKEGIEIVSAVRNGEPIDKVYEKDREKMKKQEKIEKEKLSSNIYKLTHPFVFINNMLSDKLSERGRRKDN